MRRQAIEEELQCLTPPTDPDLDRAEELLGDFPRVWHGEPDASPSAASSSPASPTTSGGTAQGDKSGSDGGARDSNPRPPGCDLTALVGELGKNCRFCGGSLGSREAATREAIPLDIGRCLLMQALLAPSARDESYGLGPRLSGALLLFPRRRHFWISS